MPKQPTNPGKGPHRWNAGIEPEQPTPSALDHNAIWRMVDACRTGSPTASGTGVMMAWESVQALVTRLVQERDEARERMGQPKLASGTSSKNLVLTLDEAVAWRSMIMGDRYDREKHQAAFDRLERYVLAAWDAEEGEPVKRMSDAKDVGPPSGGRGTGASRAGAACGVNDPGVLPSSDAKAPDLTVALRADPELKPGTIVQVRGIVKRDTGNWIRVEWDVSREAKVVARVPRGAVRAEVWTADDIAAIEKNAAEMQAALGGAHTANALPPPKCDASTTIRSDEHETYNCALDAGHQGAHYSGDGSCQWTDVDTAIGGDETTRSGLRPDDTSPDAETLRAIILYLNMWAVDGDTASHSVGHIASLVERRMADAPPVAKTAKTAEEK